jgi:hypothetical protein
MIGNLSSLALSLSPMGVILPPFASAQRGASVEQANAGQAADAGISGDGPPLRFPSGWQYGDTRFPEANQFVSATNLSGRPLHLS